MLLNQNDIFAGRYVLQRMLGKGGFSVVWNAVDKMTNDTVVAIKIYAPDKGLDDSGVNQFSREYSLVHSLHHNRLLTARHFDVSDGSPYLVLPFCSKGSVGRLLADKGTLSEKEIAKIVLQISEGLEYLHQEGIIHQDIKPDNVLINEKEDYLLTDFGISSRVRNTIAKSTGNTASMTLAYTAPERFSATPTVLPASDMFAVGVMIYEMATGDVPWMGQGGLLLLQGAAVPELPAAYSRELSQWMQSLMAKDPAMRPDAKKLKEAAQKYLNSGQWPVTSSSSIVVDTPVKKEYKGRETHKMEDIHLMQQHMKAAEPVSLPKEIKSQTGRQTLAYGQGNATVPVKRSKGYAGIIGVCAVVLLIGGGVWYYLSNTNTQGKEAILSDTSKTVKPTVAINVSKDSAVTAKPKKDSVVKPARKRTPAEEVYDNLEIRKDWQSVHYYERYPTCMCNVPVPSRGYSSFSGATFVMGNNNGSQDEQPEHKVTLPHTPYGIVSQWYYMPYCKVEKKPFPMYDFDDEFYAVIRNVSWYDAVAYCKWLSKQSGETWTLPTEAECEYLLNHAPEYSRKNLSQNALYWCSDWYAEDYYQYSPSDSPKGPASGTKKVVRGINSGRLAYSPSYKSTDISFFVVKRDDK